MDLQIRVVGTVDCLWCLESLDTNHRRYRSGTCTSPVLDRNEISFRSAPPGSSHPGTGSSFEFRPSWEFVLVLPSISECRQLILSLFIGHQCLRPTGCPRRTR